MADNEIILNEEMLKEKYSSQAEIPSYIRVDASTFCQLRCPSCYMRKDTEGVKNGCGIGHLKFADFKRLIDENKHLKKIELSNSGEPFLNPELADIIEYAYLHGVRTSFTNGVNLNYLSDRQAETLVKCEVDTVTVSIDGASQETYGIYRVGGNYEKVLENVRKILKYKEKYKDTREFNFPYINWKFIVFGHNEHEIVKVKDDAEKLGVDDLIFDTNWDNVYSPVKNPEFVKKETGIDALDINVSPVVQLKEYLDGKIEWYFCRDLWEPQINWDGKVLGCCANYKSDFGGNVFKEGLMQALNHPKMIYAKNMVMNKAPAIDGIPCTTCWCYKAMKEADIWLTSPKDACHD
ncbi:MAG: radical SAM protein [Candidatus Gastranaerophilales bacterium]|nr:radical SAM protein [Candidatus Gastranaerophilales bacterium]